MTPNFSQKPVKQPAFASSMPVEEMHSGLRDLLCTLFQIPPTSSEESVVRGLLNFIERAGKILPGDHAQLLQKKIESFFADGEIDTVELRALLCMLFQIPQFSDEGKIYEAGKKFVEDLVVTLSPALRSMTSEELSVARQLGISVQDWQADEARKLQAFTAHGGYTPDELKVCRMLNLRPEDLR